MKNEKKTSTGFNTSSIEKLPKGWECITLNKVLKLSSGTTKPSDFENEKTELKIIPVFGGNGITGYSSKYFQDGENLIIGRVGEKCGCLHYYEGKCWITDNALYTVSFDKKSDLKFYSFLLDNYDLSRTRSKGGQPLVSQKPIHAIRLNVPASIKEQRAIANLINKWDDAIYKTQQLITQLQQRNKWLMQNLLTGKKRLMGFEKEKWKRVKANEVFESVSAKNNASEEPLLSVTQDRGVLPRDMLVGRVTMPSGTTAGFKLVEKGNFVISLRSFQGGLEYSEYRGLVSPAYTVLRQKKKINTEFYKFYFKSYDFIGHLAVTVIGIRDGKQVSYDDFSILRIPSPSLDEQNKIAAILSQAETELKISEQKLLALKEQKKGMMQVLLTGKKRVKI